MMKNVETIASLIETKKNTLILLRNDIISEIDNEIAKEKETAAKAKAKKAAATA